MSEYRAADLTVVSTVIVLPPPFSRRRLLGAAFLLSGGMLASRWKQTWAAASPESRNLDLVRYSALDALTETMLPRSDTPGARDAGVPQRFDGMLATWASAERRVAFTKLLDDVDETAISQYGAVLAALPADRQLDVVAQFDRNRFADPQYRALKGLVLTLYYTSEPGATQDEPWVSASFPRNKHGQNRPKNTP